MAYGYNTPVYGYRTARHTTALPAYYDTAGMQRKAKQQGIPLLGGNFLFQQPLVAGATPKPKIQPVKPQRVGDTSPAAAPQQPQRTQPIASPDDAMARPNVVYDYTTDPILQQIQALSQMEREQADAEALGLRRQLAIRYGDSSVARDVLGDEQTAVAAEQNPNSVLAQLRRQREQAVQQLDEALNQNNLFYSGARVQRQGELAEDYGQAQYDVTQNLQDALSQVERNRLAAHLAAQERERLAAQEAAARMLQEQLALATAAPPPSTPAGGFDDTDDGMTEMRLDLPDRISGSTRVQPPLNFATPSMIDMMVGALRAPARPQFASAGMLDDIASVAKAPKKKPRVKLPTRVSGTYNTRALA